MRVSAFCCRGYHRGYIGLGWERRFMLDCLCAPRYFSIRGHLREFDYPPPVVELDPLHTVQHLIDDVFRDGLVHLPGLVTLVDDPHNIPRSPVTHASLQPGFHVFENPRQFTLFGSRQFRGVLAEAERRIRVFHAELVSDLDLPSQHSRKDFDMGFRSFF